MDKPKNDKPGRNEGDAPESAENENEEGALPPEASESRRELAKALRQTLEQFAVWCNEKTGRLEELSSKVGDLDDDALEEIRVTLTRLTLDKEELLKRLALAERFEVVSKDVLSDAVDASGKMESLIDRLIFSLPLKLNDYLLNASRPFGEDAAVRSILAKK